MYLNVQLQYQVFVTMTTSILKQDEPGAISSILYLYEEGYSVIDILDSYFQFIKTYTLVGIFLCIGNKSTDDANAYMATGSTCRSTNISISAIGSNIVEIGIIWIVEI